MSASVATGGFAGPMSDDRRSMSSYVGESLKRLGVLRMG